jgi:hypothetical protein
MTEPIADTSKASLGPSILNILRKIVEVIVVAAAGIIIRGLVDTPIAIAVVAIGGIVLLIAHNGFVRGLWSSLLQKSSKHPVVAASIMSVIVVVSFVSGYVTNGFRQGTTPKESTYLPFEKAKREIDLGKPITGPERLIEDAYQGVFDNAISIWTANGAYVLWDNESKTWEELIEGSFPPIREDQNWQSDSWVRSKLHLRDSCRPPVGSMARAWDKEPNKWSKIGCRQWHCPSTPAYYQEFENGVLIGTFRGDEEGAAAGIVYAIISKPQRSWKNVTIENSLKDSDGLGFVPKKGNANCSE